MNVQNSSFDYTPKKSRAPKIIAQILSVLFVFVMAIIFIVAVTITEPEFVPYESVNLYNADSDNVYELRDLTVVSNYAADDYSEYYLVLLPYKDETIKAASLCCDKYSDLNLYIQKYMRDNNAELGNCVVSVGATVNSMDILYDSTIAVYENAVEGLKESGLNVMSTELSLEFVCLPDGSDFEEYCRSEKSFNHVMTTVVFVLLILGIVAVVFSYRERKGQDGTAVYYNPDFKPQY